MLMTKKMMALVLALMLVVSLAVPAMAQQEGQDATILFTHDLHSQFLPMPDGDGAEVGGYARLMTAILLQKQLHPNAVLLDGGDFSMGSLFQTAYATAALELRIMGAMGYDVTTFGNHEFDYLPQGLASMLHAAKASGDRLPALVEGNYLPPKAGEDGYGEDAKAVWAALENYGAKEYVLLERGGVHFAVIGLYGEDADACAPNSGMVLQDPAKTCQKLVDAAKKDCKEKFGTEPVVVVLSHSGTEDGKGEDYALAQKVEGIHLIISGHTHTELSEPIQVGGTYIVSVGEYAKNLGVVQLHKQDGEVTLTDYQMIPITDDIAEDETIAALVESYKKDVEDNYLSDYGVSFDQVLVNNPYVFDTVDEVYDTAHESDLGNLFSDAYKWAAEKALGGTVDLALTASGVIRDTIPLGDVTVSNVFCAASLGVGTEGELVAVYITGKDVKNALEVDASVYPLMHSAALYYSGVEYSFNTNRMIFNKVDYAMLRRADGSLEQIQDDKLYRVVTGMYAGQMLGSVEATSFGLLTITPRDENGEPIAMDELVNFVVKDADGVPVKEWYAIASYLQEMGGTMDAAYDTTDGRKVVYASWAPVAMLRNANVFTYVALGLVLVLIGAVCLVTVKIVRKKRK